VRASVLRHADVDHQHVLVQVTFLGEPHFAVIALIRLLFCVCPQVVEELAHRKYRERTLMACFLVLVLTLKELEEPSL
jgi:hypothetical protein